MPESLPEFLVAQRLRARSLGDHIVTFATLLADRGYATSTTKELLRLVADLGHWLGHRQRRVEDLDEKGVGQFLQHRRRRGRRPRSNGGALRVLLGLLRDAGVVRPVAPAAVSPIDRIVQAFDKYLIQERGVGAAGRANYVPVVRRLLSLRFGAEPVKLRTLCPEDVTQFVVRELRKLSPARAKLTMTALRSFLRWLHQRGDTPADLGGVVPRVADWRLATLPKSITSDQVESLLEACDRRNAVGQRDYAILLMLARLGLRAGEIVAMDLEDLDWDTGELVVRGKGGRRDRLPLPRDVGAAVAAYLRLGRPTCSTRRVFIRMRAPLRGFANSIAICTIVERALTRAELDPPRKGAHLLRHALACTMLRGGASLAEIGEILRHRSPNTTAIYAKVDVTALRALAPAWPCSAGDA
jgi:site-specific recombinase XerD